MTLKKLLPSHTSMNALIVDDDQSTLCIIADAVRSLGVNTVECEDGKDALNALKASEFDIVVSDLIMPKMSGMMLLHSMLEEGYQIPFIFVTGFSDKDSAIQALRLGAFDYLEKPFEIEDLKTIVVEALRVSKEQKALIQTVAQQATNINDLRENRSAEIQIMKMRTFRFKGEALDFTVSKSKQANWVDLRDLFVKEAEPQLIFCEAAIQGLEKNEDRHHELAFLQRVVQSVRMASEAMRVNDIAEFAWSLENCLASIKYSGQVSNTKTISKSEINLLMSAVRQLNEKVSALADPKIAKIQKELDDLSNSTRTDKVS
jgi:DNA-binding response OmpR family regulator